METRTHWYTVGEKLSPRPVRFDETSDAHKLLTKDGCQQYCFMDNNSENFTGRMHRTYSDPARKRAKGNLWVGAEEYFGGEEILRSTFCKADQRFIDEKTKERRQQMLLLPQESFDEIQRLRGKTLPKSFRPRKCEKNHRFLSPGILPLEGGKVAKRRVHRTHRSPEAHKELHNQ